ncbi:MAG: N-acetylornithine carbamoyltransferase [Bacteroidales bacterium]|jgi:N-succinyl-L-ornithine transcarbamylase|nr:N-acetylornithine carbamoyltransferase [Bacteroidales bacterium]
MKHFTSIHDVTDLHALLTEAAEIKRDPFKYETFGRHRTMGLLFFNSSLRTRLSTQKAAQNLGMNTMVLNVNEDSWKIETEFGVVMNGDKAEHIKEAAAVIGKYCDVIGIRSFPSLKDREADYSESVINRFIRYAGVPVVSMESATRHPLQSFADVITIEQYKKTPRPKVLLAWAPHCRALPQSVPNSFVEWAVAAGYETVVTHPEGYELDPSFTTGAVIEYDREKAYKDADFVYAKNWSSYTQYGKILNNDLAWTCNAKNMALTRHAKFMHCLPVRRNLVVSDEVIDSPDSIVIEEAANRVVAAQTVLREILKEQNG